MTMKRMLVVIFLCASITAQAQKNFTYSPDKPKPGDTITFTYEPAGDLAGTIKPVEGIVYQAGKFSNKADDIVMVRKGRKFSGKIITDTAASFIYFGFKVDETYDHNFNDGYFIPLYENDKPREGTWLAQANYYQYMGRQVGLGPNNEKALAAFEKEFELYPANKKSYLTNYIRVQTLINKDDAQKIALKEIESLLKEGLTLEVDYNNLETMYGIAKLPEQQKFITNLKKEKFPNGAWIIPETLRKYSQEKDIEKKKALLQEIVAKTETDPNWKGMKQSLGYYKTQIPQAYLTAKDYGNFKKLLRWTGR